MGAVPTTSNTLAGIVNGAIKAGLDGGTTTIEAVIIADVPWLGLPVVKQILEYFLGFVEKYFYTGAANAATKLVIDMQVDSEISATNAAFANVQAALASGDTSAIQKASTDLDAAFASIIHYDGSSSP